MSGKIYNNYELTYILYITPKSIRTQMVDPDFPVHKRGSQSGGTPHLFRVSDVIKYREQRAVQRALKKYQKPKQVVEASPVDRKRNASAELAELELAIKQKQ